MGIDDIPVTNGLTMGDLIGHQIKEARKKAKLTQAELAEKVGVATITIRQYESGKRFPTDISMWDKLSCALGVNALYFLGLDDFFGLNDFVETNDSSASADKINRLLAKLNSDGQKVAIERVEELTEIPKYQRKKPDD